VPEGWEDAMTRLEEESGRVRREGGREGRREGGLL
jgi:hypothetical protein